MSRPAGIVRGYTKTAASFRAQKTSVQMEFRAPIAQSDPMAGFTSRRGGAVEESYPRRERFRQVDARRAGGLYDASDEL
jgi:hypothetical protein